MCSKFLRRVYLSTCPLTQRSHSVIVQGIWTKHLQYFLTFVHPNHPELAAKYNTFIGSQSDAVLRLATDSQLDIGSVWYGANAVSDNSPTVLGTLLMTFFTTNSGWFDIQCAKFG